MKRVGVLLVLMIFCVGLVAALDFDIHSFCSEEIPGDFELPEKVPFSSEVINIYLGEESVGYLILKDKKLESHGCGENEKSTYKVYVRDEQVIEDFMEAEDVVDEYNKQRGDGGLKIEGVGFWRSMKLFFINLFSRFI